jgi:thiol peroxidase
VRKRILGALILTALAACDSKEKFEIAHESVAPGSEISWLGEKTALSANTTLKLGEPLPEVLLVNLKMQSEKLAESGVVHIISIVPSLDTEVCDRQTHLLDEGQGLDKNVQRITVSRDLPYAQRRFKEEAKLQHVTFLSDYRGGAFGRNAGLEIERNGLLARAVIVIDRQGVVRYFQITPEIYRLPDMDKAFAEANLAVAQSTTVTNF